MALVTVDGALSFERWGARPLSLPLVAASELTLRLTSGLTLFGRLLDAEQKDSPFTAVLVVDATHSVLNARVRIPATIASFPLEGDMRFHAGEVLRDGTLAKETLIFDVLWPRRTYIYYSKTTNLWFFRLPDNKSTQLHTGLNLPASATVDFSADGAFLRYRLELEMDTLNELLQLVLPEGSQLTVFSAQHARFVLATPTVLLDAHLQANRPYDWRSGAIVAAMDF